MALFAERAQAADRRFALTGSNVETVIALCRALDGVPLAIKLAAARLPLFGLQGLAARLGDCLHLLRGGERGTPARQQTLLAALDWSHGLLEPAAQAVFRRLGVFAGGFPLGMAGAVAGDEALDEWAVIDTLGSLVDRSLMAVEGGEEPRYRLLEAVRDYARLRLDAAGETHAVQGRHAHATAALVDAAYEAYWMQPDRAWLDRYAPDLDNVRTALDWATRCEPPLGLRLIGGASVLFMLLGQAPEARRRQAALDAQAQAAEPGRCTARYWLERSRLHWGVANDAMHRYATLALAQSRAAGDQRGVYLALRCITGSDVEHADAAHAALAEMASLEQPDWPPRLRGQRLLAEVGVLRAARRMEEACEVSSALLAMATHAGVDSLATAALAGLAGIRLALGQTDEALRCARELIADPRARRGNFVLHAFGTIATAHLMTGDLAPARQAVASFIAASRGRDWEWLGLYAHVFAWLAACEGRAADAARLVGHAEEAVRRVGVQGPVSTCARTQALSLIEPALGAATLGSLKAEGARLDQASVGALALAASQRPL